MTTLAQYERARAALATATRIDEILPALDEVEHVKLHARQINDRGLLADATEFQERAERRLGEVIDAAKAAGFFAAHRPNKPSAAEGLRAVTLADVGVDYKLSHRAQKAAALDAETFEQNVKRTRERIASGSAKLVDHEDRQADKRDRRQAREADLGARITALPTQRYGVILADPPWRFEVYSRETGLDAAADQHYPTQTLDDIKALDVRSICAPDCALFLWATVPMLPQALEVMAAWGFAYKSHIAWVKDRFGTGYWFRNAHELLLVGTRGHVPAPAPGAQYASVLEAPVGIHSAKPEDFLRLVEAYFPTIPKIEMHRRGPARKGWDSWGADVDQEEAVA